MFHQDFSKIARPLINLLVKDVPFDFTLEYLNQALEKELTSAPITHAPGWSQPFKLMCDTSNYAIGTVLGQRFDKQPDVIYYSSRTLNDA